MAAVDLIFGAAPATGHPVNLTFGADDDAPILDAEITLSIVLPRVRPTVLVSLTEQVSVQVVLSRIVPTVEVRYESGTQRPLVGTVGAPWQEGADVRTGAQTGHAEAAPANAGAQNEWALAAPLPAAWEMPHPYLLAADRSSVQAQHQEARKTAAEIVADHQDSIRLRVPAKSDSWQNAVGAGTLRSTGWQDRLRDRRPRIDGRWSEALPFRRGWTGAYRRGRPVERARSAQWQDAMKPPAGTSVIVIPPVSDACYTPPDGDAVYLLFGQVMGDTHLLFYCAEHEGPAATVIVPIRRVYMVVNDATLRRVAGNIEIPTFDLSLSIDVDSWTWGWSASVPIEAEADLEPTLAGDPVELEATINGTAFRLLAENMTRERTFRDRSLRVSGRGKSALLAAPYAPVLSFSNAAGARTAQQLMDDVLTFNGVPIGWTIDWQITDWLVPAGAWAHQGAYIDGLGAIAQAAGAYLQPHPTAQQMRVLSRYPTAPWGWGALTPDFELPSAMTVRESIERRDKAVYNRVFVSGQSQGVLGQVTRAGTAGDLAAPMVVDPLITHADAARQRGRAVLGDTGMQAFVTLRTPVLPATGIIQPGKLVRYVDGSTVRLGLVRSTRVDVGLPDVFQTIGVETHLA